MQDPQGCELCGEVVPLDECAMTGDGAWICAGCQSRFKEAFDACAHEWEPERDQHGDAGRYCPKCSGFVIDELPATQQP